MILPFHKYQGTGNDFVMIDNRSKTFNALKLPIAEICDRRFGVGADGLIVIENHDELDFHMIYFNSDGSQSFCGNGSRCAVAFAKSLGIIQSETNFLSTDGPHYAQIDSSGEVKLKMHDVLSYENTNGDYVIDTGSPHYIVFVEDVYKVDIVSEAHLVRYNDRFKAEGINVNFIHPTKNVLEVRTYERGVEAETLSCGTGVTASALANYLHSNNTSTHNVTPVKSMGGELSIEFSRTESGFSNIYLIGPAEKTFEGEIQI